MLNEVILGRTKKDAVTMAKVVRPKLDEHTLANLPEALKSSLGTDAPDVLIDLFDTCVFDPGLPLQIYGLPHVPATQGVFDSGDYQTAKSARNAAAVRLSNGATKGLAFEQVRSSLLLRLDLRGNPLFGAELPAAPAPALEPPSATPGI